MKKFKDLQFHKQVKLVYIYSLVCSFLLSPLFGKLFKIIFHPSMSGGLFPAMSDPLELIGGTLLAFFVFLPLFSFLLLKRKGKQVWFFGFIFPFLLMLISGFKDIAWALILSLIGWGLAEIGLRLFQEIKTK